MAEIVRLNVIDASLTPLPLALIVRGYVPTATLEPIVNVTDAVLRSPQVTTLPPPPVTPAGAPVTVTVTSPVNPPVRVTVPTTTTCPPGATVADVVFRPSEMAPVPPVVSLPEPQDWVLIKDCYGSHSECGADRKAEAHGSDLVTVAGR